MMMTMMTPLVMCVFLHHKQGIYFSKCLVFPLHCFQRNPLQRFLDRRLLGDLFENTNGKEWRRFRKWGSSSKLDKWDGVMSNDDAISELNLSKNKLSGKLRQIATHRTILS